MARRSDRGVTAEQLVEHWIFDHCVRHRERADVRCRRVPHEYVELHLCRAALREKLVAGGSEVAAIDRVKAPAGLDLGAITPEEIAMSILAEITVERRRGQRTTNPASNKD